MMTKIMQDRVIKIGQYLIKVINADKAKYLAELGFSYIKENINNQDVFVFTSNPEIIKCIQSNFNKSDFVIENTLRF